MSKKSRIFIVFAVVLAHCPSFGASGYNQCGGCRTSCHLKNGTRCRIQRTARHYVRHHNRHHQSFCYVYDPNYIPGVTIVSVPVVVEECDVSPDMQCCSVGDTYRHHGLIGGVLRLIFGICFGDGLRSAAVDDSNKANITNVSTGLRDE